MFLSSNTDLKWKFIITYSVQENILSSQNESYFQFDPTYTLSKRWQSPVLPTTPINNVKVLPVDQFSMNPTDSFSFSVVLNISDTEIFIGTIDGVSREIQIDNPQQHLPLKCNSLSISIYENPATISASIAYQSAGNQYNIFMNELKTMWKHKLTNILFQNIQSNSINANKELKMNDMYALVKKLHKRCKSDYSWNDLQIAFNKSFQNGNANSNKVLCNVNDDSKEKLSSGFGGMQLENALSKFKLRGIVLLIEYEIERFIKHCFKHKKPENNLNEYVLLFPECNDYYRLLIDKISERFGCYTKTYGEGNRRRIFVYCRIGNTEHINIPKRLSDVTCFIPVLKLRDLIKFGQFNDLINRSLKYMTNVLVNKNKKHKFSDFIQFENISVCVNGLSYDINCNKTLYVYFEWNNIFNASKLNIDKERIDITCENIGYDHIYEIEINNIGTDSMNVFMKYLENNNNNNGNMDIKLINKCRVLVIFKTKNILNNNLETILNQFNYKNMTFKINTMRNASDLCKYMCGFCGIVMNKTRGIRSSAVAKRIIQHYTQR